MAFRIGPPVPPHPQFKRPPGATPPGQTPDKPKTLFEQLKAASWRDIEFPISSMKVTLSHDLVEHKYWGVDAANVEATGRAPMEIEAVIPFVNGIVPGKGEKWGVLYPTTFRQFLEAFADKKTGILVHPEMDQITCRPQSIDFALDAQRRDGVEVTARWVETRLDDDDGKVAVGLSPIEVADLAALDLDASKTDLLALVPDAPFKDFTFDDLVNKISGFLDQISLTANLLTSKPGQILNRVQQLQNSVGRVRSALTWQTMDNLEKVKSAIIDIKNEQIKQVVGRQGRSIFRYTTTSRTTLSGLQALFPRNSTDDFIRLNPSLLSRPEVPAGTVIRYYG